MASTGNKCDYMYMHSLYFVQATQCTIVISKLILKNCYILYPIVQRNHWFANPDVPFQSVTNDLLNGQFAMQMYALHQVDVTSELLHLWWFAHAQSNKKTQPSALFLSPRLEASADKSNVTLRAIH